METKDLTIWIAESDNGVRFFTHPPSPKRLAEDCSDFNAPVKLYVAHCTPLTAKLVFTLDEETKETD